MALRIAQMPFTFKVLARKAGSSFHCDKTCRQAQVEPLRGMRSLLRFNDDIDRNNFVDRPDNILSET